MTAGAHILAIWALWTLVVSTPAVPQVPPLWVSLLGVDAAPPPPPATGQAPPPLPEAATPRPPTRPVPEVPREPTQAVAPAPAFVPTVPAVPAAAPVALQAREPAAAPAPVPVAARPAPPRLLRADQVRYRVTPPAEVPLLSRRAGESGVVWLRVLIDTQGRPARVTLHRSSGFKRLDEQALAAMAQARFAPQTEDGVAVEAEVLAPIEYPAD